MSEPYSREEGEIDDLLRRTGPPPAPPSLDERMEALLKKGRPPALPAWKRPVWWGLAAAAAFLMTWRAAPWDPPRGAPRTLPEGRRISGVSESLQAPPGRGEVVELPDGTRFRVGRASRIRFQAPGEGERFHVRLDEGELAGDVLKGAGQVRVVAEAGEVVVVGTQFVARAFRIYPLAAESPLPVLSVEVGEGGVDLEGPSRVLRVAAQQRGIIWGSDGSCLQERGPLSWREAVRRWGRGWSRADFPASPGALTLLATSWKGFDGWRCLLEKGEGTLEERGLAAVLVGATAGPDAGESLLALYAAQEDAGLRRTLAPYVVRRVGPERVAAADRTAAPGKENSEGTK